MPITGIADMKAAFAAMGIDFETKALPKVMRRVAVKGAQVAKAYAPVDDGVLRDSIRVRKLSKRKTREEQLTVAYVVAPMSKGGAPENEDRPKPASVIGMLKEFGTEKMEPEPFMRPMADELAGEIVGGVTQEIGEELKRSIKRAARVNT